MNKKIKIALKKAIKHWKNNIKTLQKHKGELFFKGDYTIVCKNKTISYNEDMCPLCQIMEERECFNRRIKKNCIISYDTGNACNNTPWVIFRDIVTDTRIINDKMIEAAEMEYIYLLNLLYCYKGGY